MDEGYVQLWRQFFSHPFWCESRSYSRAEAWIDLIQMAAFKQRKALVLGAIVQVPRGGIVASVRFLSDRWKWSKTKVCQFLELLRLEGMIETKEGQQKSLFFLCKYDHYNAEKGQQRDVERTTIGQRKDEVEEGEEGKGYEKAGATAVELPRHLPQNKEAAERSCPTAGIPPEFLGEIWEQLAGRGGRDATDVPIRSWSHFASSRWGKQRTEWEAKKLHPNGKRFRQEDVI